MAEHEEQHASQHCHCKHGGGDHEEHEGAPEWLISFADNVVLMMGFFVILLAMNMKPTAASAGGGPQPYDSDTESAPDDNMLDLAIAIRAAFNNPVDPESEDPIDESLAERLRQRLYGVARDKGADGDFREVLTIRPGRYHSDGAHVNFDRNSSTLSEASLAAIKTLADQARGMRSLIEIRGYVSAAESYKKENHGVELSYARAFEVGKSFVALGIGWERLRLIACADNDLVVRPAYDEADHRRNQRVEIIFTNNAVEEAREEATTQSAEADASRSSPAEATSATESPTTP